MKTYDLIITEIHEDDCHYPLRENFLNKPAKNLSLHPSPIEGFMAGGLKVEGKEYELYFCAVKVKKGGDPK